MLALTGDHPMAVSNGNTGIGCWFAERARAAVRLFERLFGTVQVYRQIAQAGRLRHEVDVLAWTVILRADGTALAEHRLTGKTLELTAAEAAAVMEAAAPPISPPSR